MMIVGNRFLPVVVTWFIWFLYMGTNGDTLMGASSNVQCIASEREALLSFKHAFTHPSMLFSSWIVEEDCCRWTGVGCNDSTGHVISLDLRNQHQTVILQGMSVASLLDLPYLSYLDLSGNDFRQIRIPESIGSLISLEHLNLSNSNFRGLIPDHLGNLSSLESLDLSGNSYSLKANNLYWLHGLFFLKVLDLGGVDLSSAAKWFDEINMLPSLVELNLSACRLNNVQASLPYVNFTSLEILDLSLNSFSSTIPSWLFNISHSLVSLNLRRSQLRGWMPNAFGNMTSLAYLDISENHLKGEMPNVFGNMISLAFLDLSKNRLEGEIPKSLGLNQAENQVKRPSKLKELYLSQNKLNGSLEQILPQLSQLVVLDVASNLLEGVISEVQLSNFSRLRVLDLSSNLLTFNVSSGWIPPFQLDTIGLRDCQLGPKFPEWLRSQKDFTYLDISNSNISGTVPHWFWVLSYKVKHMVISSNKLRGKVPDFFSELNLSTLNLSYNSFDGPLPHFPPSIESLILSGNSFSGGLSSICQVLVPKSNLNYLDLSRNQLSGEIPDCWTHGQKLVILNLANNNLYGKIPDSIGHLVHLNSLQLGNNILSGELPSSLKSCTGLSVLNLGRNKFSGKIPAWIGEEMPELMILIFRANQFEENIPTEICLLKSIKILDLSLNSLSGSIPRCINNFLVMSKLEDDRSYVYNPYTSYVDHVLIAMYLKIFNRALVVLMGLDLSSNKLSGDIPKEISSLVGLSVLNLSRNHLAGTIPDRIGDVKNLEALDLSWNKLSCTIPANLLNLTFLEVLDLSHNRLSGEIPKGGQFSTFENSSYMDNRNLCGLPLANDCLTDGSYEDRTCEIKNEQNDVSQEDGGDPFEILSFHMSMGLGFIAGFWGICGPLLIKSSWRHAYYRFLVDCYDKIYVIVVVYGRRLTRKFQRIHVAECEPKVVNKGPLA
ncbi:receptor-like protein EIX2 [Actinidia eriantha]|uniref:receptor-like protein EIX2 n=1 Tax=Actinidia eriantha TaxID=165200 RepID=UPI0025890D92|nr:receptor-like protein EIX2 [Actinidia eriantha]